MAEYNPVTPLKRNTVNSAIITKQIYRLSKVMPKVWKQIDWYLSPQNKNEDIRKDIVIALLKKALPNNLNAEDLRNQRASNQILIITNGSQTEVQTNGQGKVKVVKSTDIQPTSESALDTEFEEVIEDGDGGEGCENSEEAGGGAPKVESVDVVKDPHKISPNPDAKSALDSNNTLDERVGLGNIEIKREPTE